MRDCLGCYYGVSAWPVLDDEWLTEPRRQPLPYQARYNVGCAAGCKTNDDAHLPCRIPCCPPDVRDDRERGSASGQTQKLAAPKFNAFPQ
jgi:hypothetical protein